MIFCVHNGEPHDKVDFENLWIGNCRSDPWQTPLQCLWGSPCPPTPAQGADAAEGGSGDSRVLSSLWGHGSSTRCIRVLPGGQRLVWGLGTTLLVQGECEVLHFWNAGMMPGSGCFSSQPPTSSENQARSVQNGAWASLAAIFYLYHYQSALLVLLSCAEFFELAGDSVVQNEELQNTAVLTSKRSLSVTVE